MLGGGGDDYNEERAVRTVGVLMDAMLRNMEKVCERGAGLVLVFPFACSTYQYLAIEVAQKLSKKTSFRLCFKALSFTLYS